MLTFEVILWLEAKGQQTENITCDDSWNFLQSTRQALSLHQAA